MLRAFGDGLFGEQYGTAAGTRARPARAGCGRGSDFREVLDGLDALALDLPGLRRRVARAGRGGRARRATPSWWRPPSTPAPSGSW